MNPIDYLSDLDKWQACSPPELAKARPEELFAAPFVEVYGRLHNDLLWRIIRLHGTLRTLEQLNGFPFDYVYAPNGMEFWRLVILNFLDNAILLLHGLVNDSGDDVHTLVSFRSAICKAPWLAEDKLELFKLTLRERKFDHKANAIASAVAAIRHNRIAHRLVDQSTGNPREVLTVVHLEQMRKLFNAAHSLFGALSFGSSYITLAGDLTPATIGGVPIRTSLDSVLDAVLRDNPFVNQPERNAPWWEHIRKAMDAEQLQLMNELRKRIGLPEA